MRTARVAALVLAAFGTSPSVLSWSDEGLNKDRIAVYRAFLARYDKGHAVEVNQRLVNLGDRSTPLEISAFDRRGCVRGIDLPDLAEARSTTHRLTSEILANGSHLLVDSKEQLVLIGRNNAQQNSAAPGLLQISEISFDRAHRYAVFRFDMVCGGLCGRGGTLVYTKTGGQWKPANRHCESWIS